MPTNNLQRLYNRLERTFAAAENTFLHAEKIRHDLKSEYQKLLAAMDFGKRAMARYPQAQLMKRLHLIETLLKDLTLRQTSEKRSFDALGFMLSRLRLRLASEMLEPKLYGKIRAALAEEKNLAVVREKYPDADAVITAPAPKTRQKTARSIRLLLIGSRKLYYAIPVQKIVKKTPPGPVEAKLMALGFSTLSLPGNRTSSHTMPLVIAFENFAGRRRIVHCDEYFTPIELPQKLLRRMVTWAAPFNRFDANFRPQIQLYGRRFFLYGARLSYTVRPGERKHPAKR
jgi:hypothetical protein